jgi:hypothetical protein
MISMVYWWEFVVAGTVKLAVRLEAAMPAK